MYFLITALPSSHQWGNAPLIDIGNIYRRLSLLRWNSYNHYACAPNETIIRSNAQALVDSGLQARGYHFVVVDCGWTLPNRTTEGTLTWNPSRFPNGYPALGEFIHSLELGFGVYSDGGIKTCMLDEPEQAGSLRMPCFLT